ncbi:hypothetical protein [Brenneria salicis]|uniref:hypothetical protein n=1 Tax=Brenneria salicis TaxID=55214 RepID=UPI00145AE180|nr:hypothetical protein [Brenneria salicis]
MKKTDRFDKKTVSIHKAARGLSHCIVLLPDMKAYLMGVERFSFGWQLAAPSQVVA